MRNVLARRSAGLVLGLVLAAATPPLAAPDSVQRGTLRILVNGQPIGSERYEITTSADEIQARGEVEIRMGDVTFHQTAGLWLGADLAPHRYEFKLDAPKKSWVTMEFKGSEGTIHYPRPDGQEDQQTFSFPSTRVVLLDNNFFHHYLLLARLYDYAKGGAQTFSVVVPTSVQPGQVTVELKGVETLPVDGHSETVRHLLITTEDNQVEFWVSESGRFVRLRAPLGNVEVVPEGAG